MKTLRTLAALTLLSIAPSFAITFPSTFTTTLGVIGDPAKFQINSFTFSNLDFGTNQLTMGIDFNYGGGFTGGAFQSFLGTPGFTNSGGPVELNVGDIFFSNGSTQFAVAMSGHNGLTQGNLYQITGTQTAQVVLGNPVGGDYRPNQAVWMSPTGASLVGSGVITATSLGGNHFNTQVQVNTNAAFRAFLGGNFDFTFESATCGNDVVYGTVTPEPESFVMLSAGLLALGLLRRKTA